MSQIHWIFVRGKRFLFSFFFDFSLFSILFQIVSGALISDLPGNLFPELPVNLFPVLTGYLAPLYHVIILLLRGAKLCRDFAD